MNMKSFTGNKRTVIGQIGFVVRNLHFSKTNWLPIITLPRRMKAMNGFPTSISLYDSNSNNE